MIFHGLRKSFDFSHRIHIGVKCKRVCIRNVSMYNDFLYKINEKRIEVFTNTV